MRPKVPHSSMCEFLFLYSTKSLRINFVDSSLPKLADPCTKSTAHLLIVYPAIETNEASNSIYIVIVCKAMLLPVGGGVKIIGP